MIECVKSKVIVPSSVFLALLSSASSPFPAFECVIHRQLCIECSKVCVFESLCAIELTPSSAPAACRVIASRVVLRCIISKCPSTSRVQRICTSAARLLRSGASSSSLRVRVDHLQLLVSFIRMHHLNSNCSSASFESSGATQSSGEQQFKANPFDEKSSL